MSTPTYIAELDSSNAVLRVIIAQSTQWAVSHLGGTWVECYDRRYPGPGWTYDSQADDFVPQQPFPSWTWDGEAWQPPVPMPEEGEWTWDEDAGEWVQCDEGEP